MSKAFPYTCRQRGCIRISGLFWALPPWPLCSSRSGGQPFDCYWLDTARVARRAWSDFSRSGYGLKNLAAHCGITFTHHDALEDARAAGEILLRAVAETGSTVAEWCARVNQPLTPKVKAPIARQACPDGLLVGDVVAFTGALSITRSDAADMASAAGCEVGIGVTKHTTLLVVGDHAYPSRIGSCERLLT